MREVSVLASEDAGSDKSELGGLELLLWPTNTNFLSSNLQSIFSRKRRPHTGFFRSQPFFLDLQLIQPLVVRTPCIFLQYEPPKALMS
jgi:hypothetical protein